jgi:hypothetical protein
VPAPITTAGVAVPKVTPAIAIDVPRRFRHGRRPTAFVEVKHPSGSATGTVILRVKGARAMTATLRSGLVRFRLPALKPGRHLLKATYPGTAEFEPVAATATVTVRRSPERQHRR